MKDNKKDKHFEKLQGLNDSINHWFQHSTLTNKTSFYYDLNDEYAMQFLTNLTESVIAEAKHYAEETLKRATMHYNKLKKQLEKELKEKN